MSVSTNPQPKPGAERQSNTPAETVAGTGSHSITTPPSASKQGGVREVVTLATPVILTQMSATTMHIVDSAFVGRLGPAELAAVGFGGIWIWTALCFFVGTSNAVQTFVAQDYGAGHYERCGSWTWQTLWGVIPAVAIAAGAIVWWIDPIVAWLAPAESARPLAVGYVSHRMWGAVGLTAAITLSNFFRGLGDTRTPLYAAIVANLVNAGLDYGLIFGEWGLPEWGVRGAGTASSVGEWVNFLFLWIAMRRASLSGRFQTHAILPKWSAIRRLLRTGIPIGGQWLLEMLSFAVFMTLVARMGNAPMAASQIFIALLSISFMQAIGLSIGVSTLVGQYIGARQPIAVMRSFNSGLKLGAALGGAIALVFVAIPETLLRVFTDDPAVLAVGRPLLRIGALYQVADAFAIVADGALRGAGDTRWPFLVRFVLSWGLFLPLAYVLAVTLEGGLTAAWAGGCIYVVVLAGYLVWRFRSGAWKRIRI